MIRVNEQRASACEPSLILGKPGGDLWLRISRPGIAPKDVRVSSTKCSIGSSDDCTIALSQPHVQPIHCVILRGKGKTVVRRWAPRTWLNGEHFVDARLRAGDVLKVGDTSIEILSEPNITIGHLSPIQPGPPSNASGAESPMVDSMVNADRIEVLVQRLLDAEERFTRLQADLVANRLGSADVSNYVRKLKRRIRRAASRRLDAELSTLQHERGELERQLTEYQAAAELARQELARQQADHAAEIELLRTSLTESQQALVDAHHQMSDALREMESQRQAQQQQAAERLAGLRSLEEALASRQWECARLEEQLESQRLEQAQQLQQREERARQLQLELEACQRGCASLQDELDQEKRAANNAADFSGRISALESELQLVERQRDDLQQQLDEMHMHAANSAKDRFEELEQELQLSCQQRDALRAELEAIQIAVAKQAGLFEAREAELVAECERLQVCCEELEGECADLHAQLAAAAAIPAETREIAGNNSQAADDRIVELERELDQQQSYWSEREVELTEVISYLQQQLDEIASGDGERPDAFQGPSELDAELDEETWPEAPTPGTISHDEVPFETDPYTTSGGEVHGDMDSDWLADPHRRAGFGREDALEPILEDDEFIVPEDDDSFGEIGPVDERNELHFDGRGSDGDHVDAQADLDGMAVPDPFATAMVQPLADPHEAVEWNATQSGDMHPLESGTIHSLRDDRGAGPSAWPEGRVADGVPRDEVFPTLTEHQGAVPEGKPHAHGDEVDLLARLRAMTGQLSDELDRSTMSSSQEIADYELQEFDTEHDRSAIDNCVTDEHGVSVDRDRTTDAGQLPNVDDMSIEDYMQRLLNRVGIKGQELSQHATTLVMEDDSVARSKETGSTSSRSASSLSSSTRERVQRPEVSVDLEAMRELANENTRSALSYHAKRSSDRTAVSTLATAFIALLMAAIALILSRGKLSLLSGCGIVLLIASGYLGFVAARSGALRVLKNRYSQSRQSGRSEVPSGDEAGAAQATADPALAEPKRAYKDGDTWRDDAPRTTS